MREKAIKIKRKRCASDWFLDIFKVVFLVLVTVICVYPFWNIFVVPLTMQPMHCAAGSTFCREN